MLIAGLALLVSAVFLSQCIFPDKHQTEITEWNLALIGRDGQQVVLNGDDVLSLPSVKTRGGYFSSVGVIYGPYIVKGVRIETLCDMVGGITASDILLVAARDGYSAVYDYEQLKGGVDVFDPVTLKIIPRADVDFLLIFEQNGEPLSDEDGKPFRLAITNPDDLITEGHWWVKWVNRIEIREPRTTTQD